jgi:hypothetical protein
VDYVSRRQRAHGIFNRHSGIGGRSDAGGGRPKLWIAVENQMALAFGPGVVLGTKHEQ